MQFTTKNGMSWLKNVLNNSRKQWRNNYENQRKSKRLQE